jgi:serine protease
MTMRILRLLVSFVAAAAASVLTSAQQGPPAARKQLSGDVPTPGVLRALRTEPAERIDVDATGVTLELPDVWDVDPDTGAHFRRDELLVRFKESADDRARTQTFQASRAARIGRALPANWEAARIERGTTLREAAARLSRSATVDAVSLNYRVRGRQARPNDESYALQWNFDAIGMPAAWQINPGARNDVVVAVIDSGLNTLSDTIVFSSPFVGQVPVRFSVVPDLVADGRIVSPYDFVYDDTLPFDLGGHGTHVAGTIAQQTNNGIGVAGVAYNVKLMPLKVISGETPIAWDDIFFPGNQGGSTAIVAQAIKYAADNGAHVINLSLGGPGPSPIVRDAIAQAVRQGAFVAIAAGNDGDTGNQTEYPAAYAADIEGAMTVGAVNRDRRRAIYSGFHPYVEICAPGGDNTSTLDFQRGITQVGYDESATLGFLNPAQKIAALLLGFRPTFDQFELLPLSGTSMATPHVAGVAALLYSQGIRNPAAIEEAITRFASPIDASAEECGAGLVDPRRALRGLGLAR